MTISIICTNKDPEPWARSLRHFDPTLDVQIWPNERRKEDVEFVLSWRHPEGVLQEYPNLKCVSSMGAGIDHFLNDALFPKDLTVVRIVDPLLAQSMFEYVSSMVMYYFRDFDIYKCQQQQSHWQQRPPRSMSDTTIGIMGLGLIGEYTASKLSEMGFNVVAWSRSQKNIKGIHSYAGAEQLDEFLSQANILVCLLPLTQHTRGILRLENFEKLPAQACLINVARGEHLIDEDLIVALNKGHLRGASLDVLNQEPLDSRHAFWEHSKVFLTPHCASITKPTSVAPQIVTNYRLMQAGEHLLNQVDLVRGY